MLRHRLTSSPPAAALRKFTRRGERYFYHHQETDNPSDADCRSGLSAPTLFYRRAADGNHYASVEASLPKILYGNNIRILDQTDLREALDSLSVFASAQFGIQFNALTADVARVDFCFNFMVGEERLHAYLFAASEAEPPRLKRRVIGKIETVEFANKRRKVYLYDKSREVEMLFRKGKTTKDVSVMAQGGLLRLEARFNKLDAVEHLARKQLLLPDRRAQTLLTLDAAKTVLTNALESFGLRHAPVETRDARVLRLQEAYGYGSKFQRLIGFMRLCEIYGNEKVVKLGIIKPSAYYRQKTELKDAGALIFSDYHSTLPALTLEVNQ